MLKKTVALLTLVAGVSMMAADINQSTLSVDPAQPITEQRSNPEVVFELKYDKGELNKIYLTQFRKPASPGSDPEIPAVVPEIAQCEVLCHEGLGGSPCGSNCFSMIPDELHQILNNSFDNKHLESAEIIVGAPRSSVCPKLCDYKLGYPLCNCDDRIANPTEETAENVSWSSVCDTFCFNEHYQLNGCPPCSSQTVPDTNEPKLKLLSTKEGWLVWCTHQCRQGQGGAACNCDRAPFI